MPFILRSKKSESHVDCVFILAKSRIMRWRSSFLANAFSKEVLPHMSEGDIKLFLSECNRVLKKNGQIILEIQYSNSAKGRELMKIWDPTHVTLFSKEEWLNLIKNKFNKCGLFIHFKELF